MGRRTRMVLLRENAAREHTLYRLYDAEDNLLYVGISLMPGYRFTQHRREKFWWGDVARKDLTTYKNRRDALNAEYEAIHAERPLHNIQGQAA